MVQSCIAFSRPPKPPSGTSMSTWCGNLLSMTSRGLCSNSWAAFYPTHFCSYRLLSVELILFDDLNHLSGLRVDLPDRRRATLAAEELLMGALERGVRCRSVSARPSSPRLVGALLLVEFCRSHDEF